MVGLPSSANQGSTQDAVVGFHQVDFANNRLARNLVRYQDLPDDDWFQSVDDTGETRIMTSKEVNDYPRNMRR